MQFQKTSKNEFREELWLPWQPKEKTLKIFLSQTVVRVVRFHMEIKKDIFKKSSCPKPQWLELLYLACSIIVTLYQNTSNYGPGVEISPMLWVLGFHIEI